MRKLVISVVAALGLLCAGSATAASRFFIRGGGNGHGVGMSQYGAYGYALHGKGYRFILAHYYAGTAIGTTDPNQIVRVLIADGAAKFSGATSAGSTSLQPSVSYQVTALADGSLKLVSASGKTVGTFPAPVTVTGSGPLTLAGVGRYRGALELRPDGSGGVETVNAVGLDDYVRGVVAGEMPASWALAALEVQAVAARTFAITNHVGGSAYDLYSDTRSQVYGGVGEETAATDAAVAATRGQVVTYNGSPVITYFSASSGGHTESVQFAFPGATPEPWLKGVPDPYDGGGGNPYYQWRLSMRTAAAAARLGALVKGTFRGIVVTKHGASPRIVLATIVGSRGTTTVSGLKLESVFGLLSTDATFTTITTLPGPGPAALAQLRRAERLVNITQGAQMVAVLRPFEPAVRLASGPSLHGSVFPARRGGRLLVQVSRRRRWHTVARVALGAGGAITIAVPGPGKYRFVYQGLDGPAVSVS
jgi:stage II sporulation protein D